MRFKVFSCFRIQTWHFSLPLKKLQHSLWPVRPLLHHGAAPGHWLREARHWRSRKMFSVLFLDNSTILNGLKSLDNTESLLRHSQHANKQSSSQFEKNNNWHEFGAQRNRSSMRHCHFMYFWTSGRTSGLKGLLSQPKKLKYNISSSGYRLVYFSSYMRRIHATIVSFRIWWYIY